VLPRTWFEGLMGLAGDRGARDLLRTRVQNVNVIESPDLANDVDSPADLARLRSR
jgi:CTP:molybdopterin cytidylyltransferase MocA